MNLHRPNVTGWGINTGLDITVVEEELMQLIVPCAFQALQDEVAIWLDRVLTDKEAESLMGSCRLQKKRYLWL